MDISGLDKAAVLAALYNHSRAQGLGLLHYDSAPMGIEEARKILEELNAEGMRPYFDYLKGRVMKVSLGSDELNTRPYDRDNGEGAAAHALTELMAMKKGA